MRSVKRYSIAFAVLALGSAAGAVHAEDGWLRKIVARAFSAIKTPEQPPAPSAPVAEGADLNRELGLRRSGRSSPRSDLLPDPYGAQLDETLDPPSRYAMRVDETYTDERWSDPYATAHNTYTDERWSNPYAPTQNTHSDERWSNPYVANQNTRTDERWSNPYAPSVHR
jgi:hypothetical protein